MLTRSAELPGQHLYQDLWPHPNPSQLSPSPGWTLASKMRTTLNEKSGFDVPLCIQHHVESISRRSITLVIEMPFPSPRCGKSTTAPFSIAKATCLRCQAVWTRPTDDVLELNFCLPKNLKKIHQHNFSEDLLQQSNIKMMFPKTFPTFPHLLTLGCARNHLSYQISKRWLKDIHKMSTSVRHDTIWEPSKKWKVRDITQKDWG